MKCARCGREVEATVSFGAEGEPDTPAICLRCLKQVGLNIRASVKRMVATGKAQAERERKEREAEP